MPFVLSLSKDERAFVMPIFTILIAGVLFLSTILAPDPSSAQTPARFIPRDMLVTPGEEFWLRIRLESSRILLPSRPGSGERVEFRKGDKLLGTALTGGDGAAALKYRPASAGIQRIQVVLPQGGDYRADPGEIRVAAWARGKPLLFVDLSAIEDLPEQPTPLFGVPTDNPAPRPGGAESLKRLASRYGVIYLVPPDRFLRVREWLDHHRFPLGPMGVWEGSGNLPRRWTEKGRNLRGGIAAAPEHAERLHDAGIKSVILLGKPDEDRKGKKKDGREGFTRVADWEEAAKLLRTP
ncbi:MAG: hypothetical protein HY760_01960 [Nitrospirae bacterium]|nr:hypothetical protein [Nitrospirota bacterium]